MTYSVSRKRSLIKSFTWRLIASLDTFLIAWFVTGKLSWAGSIASLEILTKTFLYYFHERGWNYVFWGKYVNGSRKLNFFKKMIFNNKKKN
ncbi:MAG: hypothetical protein CFH26_00615 [Alphaproteobacteria bacterium MarineAlpha6_Bin4]|nr:MAG: hypothetical protein CFH25_00651 [Alphaproteobacteria bacterium MarineAlpha6_Bin3]PPR37680.1 MAG: hypothetical protein CFH26_00615 [Alphaproteobacteria bacterium MarineAlpha6_Bin4]|tara:strand:- start:7898 stop:8170 length:273 start_codon:yes stop_codon:yes gene_type:complete